MPVRLRLKRDKDKVKVSELQSKFGLFFGVGNDMPVPIGTPVGGSAVNVTTVPMDPNVKAVNELLRRCILVP